MVIELKTIETNGTGRDERELSSEIIVCDSIGQGIDRKAPDPGRGAEFRVKVIAVNELNYTRTQHG